jgi:hypothetical protein
MKSCVKCDTPKPATDFLPNRNMCNDCRRAYQRDHYQRNRERKLAAARKWFDDNRDKRKAYLATRVEQDRKWNKSYKLMRNYGITLEEHDEILASQGGVCQVCKTDNPGGRGWCVDHNHTTDHVRSILCPKCNLLIGLARESPLILQNAATYLEAHDVHNYKHHEE